VLFRSRTTLTEDKIFYVRTDGSDSNDGSANTSGGAFLTIQKAHNEWRKLDNAGYKTTAVVAAGTYNISTPIVLGNGVGGGNFTVEGAGATTIIDFNTGTVPTYACCFYAEYVAVPVILKSIKLRVSNSANRTGFISLITLINANIVLNSITFGVNSIATAPYGGQILALNGSTVTLQGSTYTVDGGWTAGLGGGAQAAFIWGEGGSRIFFDLQPRVVFTSPTVIDYTYFITLRGLTYLRYYGRSSVDGVDWAGMSATGTRFHLRGNSSLDSLNWTSQASSIPGTGDGDVDSSSVFY